MRDFSQYSAREWLSCDPLLHAFKGVRNDYRRRGYVEKRVAGLDSFLEGLAGCRGGHICSVVAFNQAWVIEWLLRLGRKNLPTVQWLVFDNSSKAEVRPEIKSVCEKYEVPYLSLPPNPETHPCRSHGAAMSWIYERVIGPLQPAYFSYIDHDLIPTAPVDLAGLIGGQPVYGRLNVSPWGWSIWAGYCNFRLSEMNGRELNFYNDVPRHLDTGGKNWSLLYKDLDPSQYRFADAYKIDICDPQSPVQYTMARIDQHWLHLRGTGEKAADHGFFNRLIQRMDGGETLDDLSRKTNDHYPSAVPPSLVGAKAK